MKPGDHANSIPGGTTLRGDRASVSCRSYVGHHLCPDSRKVSLLRVCLQPATAPDYQKSACLAVAIEEKGKRIENSGDLGEERG